MSNRKKIKRPKLVIPPPEFPRIRIRERTQAEMDEIARRKAPRLPRFASLDELAPASPASPRYGGGAVPTRVTP